ncbi:kinesin-like protein KIF, partial [Acrasis kona]
MELFMTGVKNKHMASHRLNHSSSRSHCIFEVSVTQQMESTSDSEQKEHQVVTSKLCMVDLAGSEKSQLHEQEQMIKESININRSLLTLGKCISALTNKNQPQLHVPYRESQLTKLLKHSLGGNCYTLMIACISPNDAFIDENVNTLYYASRAKRIQNAPVLNEDEQQKTIRLLKRQVHDLKAENSSLQQLLNMSNSKGYA